MAKFCRAYPGVRFGRLVVVSLTDRLDNRGSPTYWLCRCDCGTEKVVRYSALTEKTGATRSCGCLLKETTEARGKDLLKWEEPGTRYGILTVIGQDPVVQKKWVCRCDCGAEISVLGTNLRMGQASCGCASDTTNRFRFRLPKDVVTLNALYSRYKAKAAERGFSWDLSKEDFAEFIRINCHYCGSPPSGRFRTGRDVHGTLVYSGVDRVNSAAGYSKNNCVPCCRICNRAKSDLSVVDFLAWVTRLTRHQST